MAETRGITFEKLKENCAFMGEDQDFVKHILTYICFRHSASEYDGTCSPANCPVWKKLKESKT
jgi:hypothetical protein